MMAVTGHAVTAGRLGVTAITLGGLVRFHRMGFLELDEIPESIVVLIDASKQCVMRYHWFSM